MIYVVEVPHQLPPRCWSRSSEQEIMAAIDAAFDRSGEVIWEEFTGRELFDINDVESTEELREDSLDIAAADLIDQHGLDTPLYQAFGVTEDGEWTVEPPDQFEAYLAYNAHDLHAQYVFMTTDEARAALEDQSAWHPHQFLQARAALRKELELLGHAKTECEPL